MKRLYKKKNYIHKNTIIEYNNISVLKNYMTETGRIIPNKITSISTKNQRFIAKNIKRYRSMGLLPYCDKHCKINK